MYFCSSALSLYHFPSWSLRAVHILFMESDINKTEFVEEKIYKYRVVQM